MDIEKYLSKFFNGTKNPSLKAMEFFMDEFDHPEKELKVIHIAGTNGKGSITEMITKVLIDAGYTVGKYMSPHFKNKYKNHTTFVMGSFYIYGDVLNFIKDEK